MILQILAWCGAFFIGFVVKGQMNHDFALRIEVNPCVIEITIGKAIEHWLMRTMLEELKEQGKVTQKQYEKIKEKLLQDYYKDVAQFS